MKRLLSFLVLVCLGCSSVGFGSLGNNLESGFKCPDDSAKPHTWWHWMNGNVSREGITADLEAMARVGIGGAQIFNVSVNILEGPAPFMSEQWFDLIKYAGEEAERLGLELCLHNCTGWSSSGGPWISAEHSMQVVVYSEMKTAGPGTFDQVLAEPESKMGFYRDIAILAFPTPKNDTFRISDLEAKIGRKRKYAIEPNLADVGCDAAISIESMIDLSSKIDNEGRLVWDVPEGEWTIMRIGHTSSGEKNRPTPKAGEGLECDKLSREALDIHWDKGIKPILDKLGPLAGKVMNNILVDSFEVGANNWTAKMRGEFKKRCGYDLLYYLPAFAGRVVEDGATTERFLWDFRRVNSNMLTENYFDYFAEKCKKAGLLFSVEPYGGPFECLAAGGKSDIVMGEFWVDEKVGKVGGCIKIAATSGHTHGQRIIGAESFTAAYDLARWENHPASMKVLGDQVYCCGINRFIFHCFAHQSWMKYKPGMTMGQNGTQFNRNNTWWDQSKGWMEYLSRCQYMLQEGRFVADVLIFAGESIPSEILNRPHLRELGYDYDVIGTDLIGELSVKNGHLSLPSGMQYRLLVLPDTTFMTSGVAEKIKELVRKGAVVVGPKPETSPSLVDYRKGEAKLHLIADEVWGEDGSCKTINRSYEKGRIVWGVAIEKVLEQLGVEPDFVDISKDVRTSFIHRKTKGEDIYFVASSNPEKNEALCSFRVSGKRPELWNSETGSIEPAAFWECQGDRTVVRIPFAPSGSMFVVFRDEIGEGEDSYVDIECKIVKTDSGNKNKLEILKAEYGFFAEAGDQNGQSRFIDVTERVAAKVKNGAINVIVGNSLAGSDPAMGLHKKLRVSYDFNGEKADVIVDENKILKLPDAEFQVTAIAPYLSVAEGKTALEVADNGRYTLTKSSGEKQTIEVCGLPDPIEIEGEWKLKFNPGWGAPEEIGLGELISWTESDIEGVRYYSGTARYYKKFDVDEELLSKGYKIVLDLGQVLYFAEVKLNGKEFDVLWKYPFHIDITDEIRAGCNELEVAVTNLWANRIIGDEQYPDDCKWERKALKVWPEWFVKNEARPVKERFTFRTWQHWGKEDEPLASGLLGPVTINAVQVVDVK